jgi:ELWxxDGT repeat protein
MRRYIILLFLSLVYVHASLAQSAPRLVKSFGMLPGTFAGKTGADLNGRYVTDSLGSLLISDGTDTGTHSIVSGFFNIEATLVVNGKLFFIGCDSLVHGNELWITDGTTAGTRLVKEIDTTDYSGGVYYFSFNDYSLYAYNNKVYFFANDGIHGTELWRSDGTDTGTVMVKDINTTAGAGILDLATFPLGAFCVAGDRLYFPADDGVHGPELWSTDGTEANTRMVTDLLPGATGANPQYLTALNGRLCFWATDGVDTGLYCTDGTDTGTHLLAAHIFTPNSEHAILHNKLYFFADSLDVANSSSLWVTDGTAAGTSWVSHAFYSTDQYSYYTYISSFLTAYHDKLYFGGVGHLWESSGTPGSTNILTDFSAIPGLCCTPTQLTSFNEKMYMRVLDYNGRVELCATDGTDTGTHIAAYPGADFTTGSSFVIQNDLTAPVTVVGTKLFFWNTYETALGHSLYVVDIAATGIDKVVTDENEAIVYPNPATNEVTIRARANVNILKVELYSSDGRLLKTVTGTNSNIT